MPNRLDMRLDRIESQLTPQEDPKVPCFRGTATKIEEQRRAWVKSHDGREPRIAYIVEE